MHFCLTSAQHIPRTRSAPLLPCASRTQCTATAPNAYAHPPTHTLHSCVPQVTDEGGSSLPGRALPDALPITGTSGSIEATWTDRRPTNAPHTDGSEPASLLLGQAPGAVAEESVIRLR